MKRYWLTEELARALTGLLGKEALKADSIGIKETPQVPSRDAITCVLHADITKVSDLVDCTRLKVIPERGDKKAWQIVIDPASAATFELDVNGTTFGPFSTSTTTAAFQTALSSIAGVTAYVIHGNFFIFPATTCVLTDPVDGVSVYEVPWMPLVGNAFATKVGCRTLFESGDLKRGGTHSAEFVHGYGFSIGSSPSTTNDTTGGGGGSSGCPCTCIETGDIVVDGVITSSRQTVAYSSAQVFTQANGKVTLPAGTYVVVYDETSGTWILDIGDVLTAAYHSGADATADSTLDGTLTFTRVSGYQPEVELCVTAEIPEEPVGS